MTHRKLLATNSKTTKKAEQIAGTDAESTMMMGNIIYNYRKSMKHRGISMIKAGTPQYTILKTVTKNVLEFYQEFEDHFTSVKDAGVQYIEIANGLMNNFNITRIPSLNEKIMNTFQAKLDLKTDEDPNITNRAYLQYVRELVNITGTLIDDPKENPAEMAHFVQVGKRCRELGVSPEVYIKTQYMGLEFCNGVPSPAQLMGQKSLGYLQKYRNKLGETITQTRNPDNIKKLQGILNLNK